METATIKRGDPVTVSTMQRIDSARYDEQRLVEPYGSAWSFEGGAIWRTGWQEATNDYIEVQCRYHAPAMGWGDYDAIVSYSVRHESEILPYRWGSYALAKLAAK